MQKLFLLLALSTMTMATWDWKMDYCESWSCRHSYNECWTPSCGLETYAYNRDYFTYYFRDHINGYSIDHDYSRKLYKKMNKRRRRRIKNYRKQLKEIRHQRKRLRALERKQRKLMRRKIRDSIRSMRKVQNNYLKEFHGYTWCDGGYYCHNSHYNYFMAYGWNHNGMDNSSQSSGDNGDGDNGSGDNGSGDSGSGDNGDGDSGDNGDEGDEDEDNGSGDSGDEDEDNGSGDNGDDDSGDMGSGDSGSGDSGSGDNGSMVIDTDDGEVSISVDVTLDGDNMVDLMHSFRHGDDVLGYVRAHAKHNVGALSLFLGNYHDDDMRNAILYDNWTYCGSDCLTNYNDLYVIWTDVFYRLKSYYNRKIVRLDGCGRRRRRLRSAFERYCSVYDYEIRTGLLGYYDYLINWDGCGDIVW